MKILSKTDSPAKFFQSLKVGEIFGFSQAFKRDDVMGMSLHHGLRVTPPSKLTPERKQYGDYVLKVRGKRTLKCQSGYLGVHTIPKDSAYTVETISGTDKNYCVECITRKLMAHVKHIQYFLNRIME